MRSRIDLTNTNAVANWLRAPLNSIGQIEQQQMQFCITAASKYWIWRLGLLKQNVVPTQSPLNEAVSYTEARDGDGKTRLWTRYRPIVSVQSLQIDDRIIPLSTAWNVAGYIVDDQGHSIQLRVVGNWPLSDRWGSGGTFSFGTGNVLLAYTAGFPSVAVANELQTIPSSTPFVLSTLGPAIVDGSIRYFVGGAPLTAVTTAPAVGQYFIQDVGLYQFAAADAGAQVQISYTAPGTPIDIQLAATQMVAINFKRREWIDQAQQSMGGSITFRDWELPPEVLSVMNYYSRVAQV